MMVKLKEITAIPTLMRWRIEVLRYMMGREPGARLLVENRKYYRVHVPGGAHKAFVAECAGEECGCGGVSFSENLPTTDNPTGRSACLVNVYVREAFRKQEVVVCIMERLIHEAHRHGCSEIYLELTAVAEPLYKALGFEDMSGVVRLIHAKRHGSWPMR